MGREQITGQGLYILSIYLRIYVHTIIISECRKDETISVKNNNLPYDTRNNRF